MCCCFRFFKRKSKKMIKIQYPTEEFDNDVFYKKILYEVIL